MVLLGSILYSVLLERSILLKESSQMSYTLCFCKFHFSDDVKFMPFSIPSSNFNIYK